MKNKKYKNQLTILISIFVLIFFTAIFTPFIAPDKSYFANQQHPELAYLPMGSEVMFLIQDSEVKIPFYKKLIWGYQPHSEMISIDFYQIKDNNIIFKYYKESEISTLTWDPTIMQIKKIRFFLGTDRMGRDVFSRILWGARISLLVGIISTFFSIVLGVFMGIIGGFYGGWIDKFVMFFVTVLWSIPSILIAMAMAFALGKGFTPVFLAIGFTLWMDVARVVRGQVLSIKQEDYISGLKTMGFSNRYILIHHVVPSLSGIITILAASNLSTALLLESGLSFLGIGIQPPMVSWGAMIQEYFGHLLLPTYHLALIPGICLTLIILLTMLLGNTLRDILDIKSL